MVKPWEGTWTRGGGDSSNENEAAAKWKDHRVDILANCALASFEFSETENETLRQ